MTKYSSSYLGHIPMHMSLSSLYVCVCFFWINEEGEREEESAPFGFFLLAKLPTPSLLPLWQPVNQWLGGEVAGEVPTPQQVLT